MIQAAMWIASVLFLLWVALVVLCMAWPIIKMLWNGMTRWITKEDFYITFATIGVIVIASLIY